jgi:hypothetical protein
VGDNNQHLGIVVNRTKVTALWDFEHVDPSALSGLILNGVQGRIPSTLSDVSIFCIAQYGKFAQRTSDAQVNAKTALRVPVTTTSDVVTVTSYPGYHNYTIGGKTATADVTNYQATATDVSQGYVVIFGTATSYLLSIKAVLNAYKGSGQPTTGNASGSTTSGSTTDNTTTASAASPLLTKTIILSVQEVPAVFSVPWLRPMATHHHRESISSCPMVSTTWGRPV